MRSKLIFDSLPNYDYQNNKIFPITDFPFITRAFTVYSLSTVACAIVKGFMPVAFATEFDDEQKRHVENNQQLSLPFNLSYTAQLPFVGQPSEIEFNANYAFIATLTHQLLIVDLNNPLQPRMVGNYSIGFPIHEIEIKNNYAFLAGDTGGLQIIDISNVTNPRFAGIYYTGWSVMHVASTTNQVWISDNAYGKVEVIDATVPNTVFRSGYYYPDPQISDDFVISGTTVYLALAFPNGLHIIDFANPTRGILLGSFLRAQSPFAVSYPFAFAKGTGSSLVVVNVSNPSLPTQSAILPFSVYNTLNGMTTILARNTIAYIGTGATNGLQILNVANLFSPTIVGSYPINICDMTLAGSLLYIADCTAGLTIIDVTNPAFPTLRSNYQTVGYQASKLYLDANTLYLLSYPQLTSLKQIIQAIDVTLATNPVLIATYNATAETSFAVSGSLIYQQVVGGFQISRMVNRTTIVPLNSYKSYLPRIKTFGNLIMLRDLVEGLVIINPQYPSRSLLGMIKYQTGQQITAIQSVNNDLFILDSSPSLMYLNTSQYLSASSTLTPGVALAVSVSNNLAFVSDTIAGLMVFDISNTLAPVLLSNYSSSTSITQIRAHNNFVFIRSTNGLLQVLDASNPYSLSLVSSLGVIANGGFTTSDQLLYANSLSSLAIINITNTSNPITVSTFFLSGSGTITQGIALANNFIYIGFRTSVSVGVSLVGLDAIDVSNTSRVSLISRTSILSSFSFLDLAVSVPMIFAKETWGARIININNPSTPAFLGTYQAVNTIACGISAFQNLALVTYSINAGLRIVDTNNPIKPNLRGIFFTPGDNTGAFNQCMSIITNKGLAYLADLAGGLQIFKAPLWDQSWALSEIAILITTKGNQVYLIDVNNFVSIYTIDVNNQTLIAQSTSYQLQHQATAMTVAGDFLFIAEGVFGVEVVDIFDSTTPKWVTQITNISSAQAINIYNNKIIVGDTNRGLIIFDLRGQPILLKNQLTLLQGQNPILSTNDLFARDTTIGANIQPLRFIISNVTHGHFELVTQPGTEVTNFTQQDISRGTIIFVHDNSALAPSYQVTVSNGANSLSANTATIYFSARHLPPVILNNKVTIYQEQKIVLTTNHLFANSTNSSLILTFTVNKVKNARFELLNNPSVFISTFRLQEIVNGQIQMSHIGSAFDMPSFETSVSDGISASPFQAANISYRSAPALITNQMAIQKSNTITLTSNELTAIDYYDQNDTLVFIITNISNGYFTVANTNTQTRANFSQQYLRNGYVAFTHDGSDTAPNYWVSVQNSVIQTLPKKAVTSLVSQGDNLDSNTAIIAGSVVGGAAVIGVLAGVGFWYRKQRQDYRSRLHDPLARHLQEHLRLKGVDNFKSELGQKFVAVVQKFITKFQAQGIDTQNMSDKNLDSLAQEIATSSKNKITSVTTMLGRSIIDVSDLDAKIDDIVSEVCKLRVMDLQQSLST